MKRKKKLLVGVLICAVVLVLGLFLYEQYCFSWYLRDQGPVRSVTVVRTSVGQGFEQKTLDTPELVGQVMDSISNGSWIVNDPFANMTIFRAAGGYGLTFLVEFESGATSLCVFNDVGDGRVMVVRDGSSRWGLFPGIARLWFELDAPIVQLEEYPYTGQT